MTPGNERFISRESAPMHNPSNTAYNGAVMGVVLGANVPIRQVINPPTNPTTIKGNANSGCVQENAPAPRHRSTRMPVLLTTPSRFIDTDESRSREKSISFLSSGLDVSMAPIVPRPGGDFKLILRPGAWSRLSKKWTL
jgi:hypothetical protein